MLRLEGMTVSSADGSGREWAQGALESLSKASPTALKVRRSSVSYFEYLLGIYCSLGAVCAFHSTFVLSLIDAHASTAI